jgi:hypothetical protein
MVKKWFLVWRLLLPWALLPLFSQQPAVFENLENLGMLIDNAIVSLEHLEQDNGSLRNGLARLEESLHTQSRLLNEQTQSLNEQAARFTRLQQISEQQGISLRKSEARSRIYKWSLIAAVPICTGLGIWLGITLPRR